MFSTLLLASGSISSVGRHRKHSLEIDDDGGDGDGDDDGDGDGDTDDDLYDHEHVGGDGGVLAIYCQTIVTEIIC